MAKTDFTAGFFDIAPLGTVADEEQFAGFFLVNACKNFYDIIHSFDFSEIGNVGQNRLAVGCECFFEMIFVGRFESLEVDEVINDPDVVFNVEILVGLIFQILRNRRHTVRFIDAELYDRRKFFIMTDQSNIRTVQRRHDRHISPLGEQDFFCHISHRRVRNRVVYVQQIQVFVAHHIHQFTCQSRVVRRIFKKRIVRIADLVKENILLKRRA